MQTLVIDAEFNGLEPTIAWCMVAREVETGREFRFGGHQGLYPERTRIRKMFSAAERIVFHNGCKFDCPKLEELGIVDRSFYRHKNWDTLVLSQLLWPDRPWGHSVEKWAAYYGWEQKVENEDWSEYTDHMMERCASDARIQSKIYSKLMEEWGSWDWSLACRIEHRIAEILYQQEKVGWKFRYQRAQKLVEWLESEMGRVENEIQPMLGMYYSTKGKPIEQPFLKSGKISKRVGDWFNDPTVVGGPFQKIQWHSISLSQREKLQDRLMEMGWEPTAYTDKGSPKLTPDKQPCPNLYKIDTELGEKLSHYFLCAHRKGQIEGWVENTRYDGRVPSVAIGNSTNTGRMAHRIIVNVPKASDKVFLGKEMRDLFTHEDGYILVGWDAEGLEMRVLAHYMNDPDFTHALISGSKEDKTDIHNLMLSASNGLIPDRDTSKGCLYAMIYGAGDAKLGWTAGYTKQCSEYGKKIREAWNSRFPKLAEFVQQVTKAAERGWVKAIDGRKVWMRRDEKSRVMAHKGLNTLIQSTGSIIVKTIICCLREAVDKKGLEAYNVTIYHDEDIAEVVVDEQQLETYRQLCHEATKKTEKLYGIRCPLEIEVNTGHSWGEVH